MPLPSRRTRALGALGVAAALGMTLAPTSDATIEPLSSVIEDAFAPRLVTVDAPTREDKNRLAALGLDLTEHAGHDYVEVVVHTAADLARLTGAGFSYDVRIPDLVAREQERARLDAVYAAAVATSGLPSGRDTYRMPEDYEADMAALAEAAPTLVKKISIGKSVEGRDLSGVEIGVGVHEPEDGRPVFLMFGNHHAREWPSAEMPMEFAIDLVESYQAGDPRVTDLLTRGRAIIVPVSNPDGFHASRTSGEYVDLRALDNGGTVSLLATPGNAYKRKNCRYIDGQTQPAGTCVAVPSPGGYGLGIDLNRNYGALWGGPGTSDNPVDPTYRGPAPFSEPETQAIRNLISTRQVTTVITNHTFGNLILRPVGVKPSTIAPDGDPVGLAPDECFTAPDGGDNGLQALGERMAAQNGYSNQFGWELYDTTGTTEDYSYNATGGYGYTFEIGHQEFHPPFQMGVVEEYLGTSEAAENVTPANAAELTTDAADRCPGTHQDHATVGGGNREAFLLAFENAVDAGTHSLITGHAPEGAVLSLQRTGVFPLWDGSLVADTVATAMTVAEAGRFEYHANPSTRPFVQSRKAAVLGDAKETFTASGSTLPLTSQDTPFTLQGPADVLQATLRVTIPTAAETLKNYDLHLVKDGEIVASATEWAVANTLTWTGPDGQGVPAGDYVLRASNGLALAMAYDLEASTADIVRDSTPRQFEQWTMSCLVDGEVVNQVGVSVERGQSVDVGDVCGAGLGTDPGNGGETPTKPKKPRKNPR
jgi:Zinc carboxypeptidase